MKLGADGNLIAFGVVVALLLDHAKKRSRSRSGGIPLAEWRRIPAEERERVYQAKQRYRARYEED